MQGLARGVSTLCRVGITCQEVTLPEKALEADKRPVHPRLMFRQHSPFHHFETGSEVIHLAVMLHMRSLHGKRYDGPAR